jgi:hypothetical protein
MALTLNDNKLLYRQLLSHAGHEIVCICYGADDVAIECEDCGEVLISADRDPEEYAPLDVEDDGPLLEEPSATEADD